MGRYAQRRRRATPNTSDSPPPPPVTIASVTAVDATHVQVFFSDDVVFDTGAGGDSNFHVGPTLATGVFSAMSSNNITVEMDGLVSSGDGWLLDGQPAWVVTVLSIPESGITL